MPKRKTSFNEVWKEEFPFIKRSQKGDNHIFCSLCKCDIEIASKEKTAIERHVSSDKHKSNVRSANSASLLTYFGAEKSNNLNDKIAAAELCKVYHTVKHHQSYRSTVEFV